MAYYGGVSPRYTPLSLLYTFCFPLPLLCDVLVACCGHYWCSEMAWVDAFGWFDCGQIRKGNGGFGEGPVMDTEG